MAKRKTLKIYNIPPNKYVNGGGTKLNFWNSGIMQDIAKGVTNFNTATQMFKGNTPSFLSLNQNVHGNDLYGTIGSALDSAGQMISSIETLTSKGGRPLEEIVGLTNSNGNRRFDVGGFMNLGTTALALAGNAILSALIKDTSGLKSQILDYNNNIVQAGSFDDLNLQWADRTDLKHISAKDLKNGSTFGNMLSAAGLGLSGGSMFGTIGAGIGAGLGMLSSGIGSLFGNAKAKREARKINKTIDLANSRNLAAFQTLSSNLGRQQSFNALSNVAAFGGLLDSGIEGALDYEFANRNINTKELNALNKQSLNYYIPNYNNFNNNTFADGGSIHIKPENRGKFTALKERTGKSATWFKEHGTPAQRKMATFALNAAKWKHGEGGPLDENTLDLINDHPLALLAKVFDPTGISSYYDVYKAGKEFYENPSVLNAGALGLEAFGAIPLVGKLGKAVKIFSKGEKSLDAIDRAGKLAEQMMIRTPGAVKDSLDMRKNPNYKVWSEKKAEGGPLFTHGSIWDNGITFINNGGTHEENPYEGVLIGMDLGGIPNLVEEGEVLWNDYVFSNRLKVPKEFAKKYKLEGNKNMTFADAAKKALKESEERPNDPISKRGLIDSMSKLQQVQERVRQNVNSQEEKRKYAHGGSRGILFDGSGEFDLYLPQGIRQYSFPEESPYYYEDDYKETPLIKDASDILSSLKGKELSPVSTVIKGPKNNINSKSTYLRYAPVLGSALGLAHDLLTKPDYSNANTILSAANKAGRYLPVSFTPIGDYLPYTPFDRNYYINKLNSMHGATAKAIMDSTNPARYATLLAADYNNQTKLGELARLAEEYNLAQRIKTSEFNRGTNQFNSENFLKAAMANQEASMKANASKLQGIEAAMNMKNMIDALRSASLSSNFTNFFDNLGDIGRENYTRNTILSNPAVYYYEDDNGNIHYKKGYYNLNKDAQREVDADIKKRYKNTPNKDSNVDAFGGYLTIKNRRK